MQKFSLQSFLIALAEIGPSLITGIMNLTHETGSVSKTQLASDSLHLATGVTAALASSDPVVVADAQVAQSIGNAVVSSIAATTNQTVK